MKGLYSLSCFHLFSHVLFLSFILCLEGERMAGVEILFSNKYLSPNSCFSSTAFTVYMPALSPAFPLPPFLLVS